MLEMVAVADPSWDEGWVRPTGAPSALPPTILHILGTPYPILQPWPAAEQALKHSQLCIKNALGAEELKV